MHATAAGLAVSDNFRGHGLGASVRHIEVDSQSVGLSEPEIPY